MDFYSKIVSQQEKKLSNAKSAQGKVSNVLKNAHVVLMCCTIIENMSQVKI